MNYIEIYGTGCDKYFQMIKNVEKLLNIGKIKASFSTITDRNKIAKKGFTNLPALIINNKLLSQGDILSIKQIEKKLKTNVI